MSFNDEMEYYIRDLEIDDYDKGFFECLKELTTIGSITKDKFKETFICRQEKCVTTVVAVDKKTGVILGTGSIFYEPKFIRGCAWKGYIEDISVSKKSQGKGVGRAIVSYLEDKAIRDGCYKIVLTCSKEKTEFYEKMKFKKIEDAMAIYSTDFK